MASNETTTRDQRASSEEGSPVASSPSDSAQGELDSSRAERLARRDGKRQKENKDKGKPKKKSKKAETSKEGSPTTVLSVSHGSTVIDC